MHSGWTPVWSKTQRESENPWSDVAIFLHFGVVYTLNCLSFHTTSITTHWNAALLLMVKMSSIKDIFYLSTKHFLHYLSDSFINFLPHECFRNKGTTVLYSKRTCFSWKLYTTLVRNDKKHQLPCKIVFE